MFQLTKDPLFADMARAAAVGRDAFVDPNTSVASYYWDTMNKGAGPYPHHAWWQIGWITDYLMAEAELRSEGKISFPRGFVAPKVGPHQTYGFAPGQINGAPGELIIRDGLVTIEDPNVEFITAKSPTGDKLYIIAMNAIKKPLETSAHIDIKKINNTLKVKRIDHNGSQVQLNNNAWTITLKPYGIEVYTVEL